MKIMKTFFFGIFSYLLCQDNLFSRSSNSQPSYGCPVDLDIFLPLSWYPDGTFLLVPHCNHPGYPGIGPNGCVRNEFLCSCKPKYVFCTGSYLLHLRHKSNSHLNDYLAHSTSSALQIVTLYVLLGSSNAKILRTACTRCLAPNIYSFALVVSRNILCRLFLQTLWSLFFTFVN